MTDGKYQDDKIEECDDTKSSLWCETVIQYGDRTETVETQLKQERNKNRQTEQQKASSKVEEESDSENKNSSSDSELSDKESDKEDDSESAPHPYARETRSLSLSEGYAAHLYLFHLPQQLTSTIMSGLSNLLNQLELSSLLQSIVNNTIFKRRNSTPLSDGAKLNAESASSTSYNSNTFQSKTLAKLFNDKTLRTLKSSELIELDCIGGLVELDNSEAGVGHEFEVSIDFLMTISHLRFN